MFGLFKPKLEPEAYYAYLHKMPDLINVSWQKDGDYIVGEVDYGDYSFVTQAKDPQEFIAMVNEGVVISNNVPKEYIDVLKHAKSYSPNQGALEELLIAAPGSKGSWNISKEKKPALA